MPPARRRCRNSSRSRPRTSSSSAGSRRAGPAGPVERHAAGQAIRCRSRPGGRDASRVRRAFATIEAGRAKRGQFGRRPNGSDRRQRLGWPPRWLAIPPRWRGPRSRRTPWSRSPPGGDTADDRDAPNKATLGSTSYDGADGQPFEPDWGGASWYGTTSGTYWTINPKEYADPRKHGPEYQARARRAARTRARAGALGTDGSSPAEDAAASRRAGRGPHRPPEARRLEASPAEPTHTTSSWWESTAGTTGTDRRLGARASRPRASRTRPNDPAIPSRYRTGAAESDIPPPDLAAAATDLGRALTDERTARGRWRFVQAVVGWLPIAVRARLAHRGGDRLRPLRREL